MKRSMYNMVIINQKQEILPMLCHKLHCESTAIYCTCICERIFMRLGFFVFCILFADATSILIEGYEYEN